jgi:BlaI family transcriptional regulator, penicillinase repressor
VIAALAHSPDWSATTIKTFLNRLLRKGAIAAEPAGKRYLYRPILQEAEHRDSESQGLLDRLFGGRLAPFVTHFSERQRLSDDDIAELRRLIESLPDGR